MVAPLLPALHALIRTRHGSYELSSWQTYCCPVSGHKILLWLPVKIAPPYKCRTASRTYSGSSPNPCILSSRLISGVRWSITTSIFSSITVQLTHTSLRNSSSEGPVGVPKHLIVLFPATTTYLIPGPCAICCHSSLTGRFSHDFSSNTLPHASLHATMVTFFHTWILTDTFN